MWVAFALRTEGRTGVALYTLSTILNDGGITKNTISITSVRTKQKNCKQCDRQKETIRNRQMCHRITSVSLTLISDYIPRIHWAISSQNQLNGCALSEDSAQPGRPPSVIRVFAVRSIGSSAPNLRLIYLRLAHMAFFFFFFFFFFFGFVVKRLT